MAHKVSVNFPEQNLTKQDITFDVRKDGKRFGTLLVSKGAIEWRPRSKQSNRKISWAAFDRMMRERG